MIKLVNI